MQGSPLLVSEENKQRVEKNKFHLRELQTKKQTEVEQEPDFAWTKKQTEVEQRACLYPDKRGERQTNRR